MARLLRIHFASIGHPKARLAPLTLDLRSRGAGGSGQDTVVWLRNGGGKSSILNLFYSTFRPSRNEFLGSSAEGKARHIHDYVKAKDLAFVVTEWDVDPPRELALFDEQVPKRRLVGQMLAWKDGQRSLDGTKLRRRFFSMLCDSDLGLDELPIQGLSDHPCASFTAFREWLDERQRERPHLEVFSDDAQHKWLAHLESIGLDTELFRYQLKMNEREGSADELFRFRTTEAFLSFYLGVALETTEADRVSATLEQFRSKLNRRPALMGERSFLEQARKHLTPLNVAVQELSQAREALDASQMHAARLMAGLSAQAQVQRTEKDQQEQAANEHRQAIQAAKNDESRLKRWVGGLKRRAEELAVSEARSALQALVVDQETARERLAIAQAACARDASRRAEAKRDACKVALDASLKEREPLKRQVERAGATYRARLVGAIEQDRTERDEVSARVTANQAEAAAKEQEIGRHNGDIGRYEGALTSLAEWFSERDAARARLSAAGTLEAYEGPKDAHKRWSEQQAEAAHRAEASAQRAQQARQKADSARRDASALDVEVRGLQEANGQEERRLQAATRERDGLLDHELIREEDVQHLDEPSVVDSLHNIATAQRKRALELAVQGAQDNRNGKALEQAGRLPPTIDVERALAVLRASRLDAFSGLEWLVANVPNAAERERRITADPDVWHGIVVPTREVLDTARALLASTTPMHSVTLTCARLDHATRDEPRVVLPGHPAHWDTHAGEELQLAIASRQQQHAEQQASLREREVAAQHLARRVQAWREQWGDGKLDSALSDHEQRVVTETRKRDTAAQLREAASQHTRDELSAKQDESSARQEEKAAGQRVSALAQFIERYQEPLDDKKTARQSAEERLQEATTQRDRAQATSVMLHDRIRSDEQQAWRVGQRIDQHQATHDAVDLYDADPADPVDLVQAREQWTALRDRWAGVTSDNKRQWEFEQAAQAFEQAERAFLEQQRGREQAVQAVPVGAGEKLSAETTRALEQLNAQVAVATSTVERLHQIVQQRPKRRRESDDLPGGETPPATEEQALARARACERELDDAAAKRSSAKQAEEDAKEAARTATRLISEYTSFAQRLRDHVGDRNANPLDALPDGLNAAVDAHVAGLRTAKTALGKLEDRARACAEAVRGVAISGEYETYRTRVKERLKAGEQELMEQAPDLAEQVDSRLEVVRSELETIDKDRRLVLNSLDKVATDGVDLLLQAERASRLPQELGDWSGQPFLKITVSVPSTRPEREARLEPLLDRLVSQGTIPEGGELVDQAVRELAGQAIRVTILKPEVQLRRERLAVTEMQTFSRGEQLTVAILLYCTLARLRAIQRGRGQRPEGGVLLLDNPVGTASNVGLIKLQRTVANQMRVQLLYTTGVNDKNAIAVFPNTVRLANAHRAQGTGDLHVTAESVVQGVRIVQT